MSLKIREHFKSVVKEVSLTHCKYQPAISAVLSRIDCSMLMTNAQIKCFQNDKST